MGGGIAEGEEGERRFTGDAKVADGVVGHEINDLVQLLALDGLLGVELVEPV